MEEQLNLATLPKYLSDEAAAWGLLERLRWDGVPVCPHCGTADEKHYRVVRKPKDGQEPSPRRVWRCRDKDCRKQFSALVGTVMESSHIPVSKWLLALYLVCPAKNAISALELQRHLGLGSYETAWFMLHRLRKAMEREPLAPLLAGPVVVADETWVGGNPKNKHRQGKVGKQGQTDKTPVFALIDRETGEARVQVVTDVTADTLRSAMNDHINIAETVLHTDGGAPYRTIRRELAGHEVVDHKANQYVRYRNGDVITSNMAESFFACFKRALSSYINVSKEHLGAYVTEAEFRWNTSKMTDHDRVEALVSGMKGKRLTYRPVG